MCVNDIIIDISDKSVTEAIADLQITETTRCLVMYSVEVAKKKKFDSNSIIVLADLFVRQLGVEQVDDINNQINKAIVGLINIHLFDNTNAVKCMPLVESVANFGYKAVKITFSDLAFSLIKKEHDGNFS